MSNTIPHNIGDINSQQSKQLNTFHTPSFGDEDFDVTSLPVMQQSHPHQMDQYQMQQQHPNHNMIDESQYMWQTAPDNHQMYSNQQKYEQLETQMHPYSVYDQSQQSHMQSQMQYQPAPLHPQQTNQNHHIHHQQEKEQLMMPPPYKSPSMNTQPQQHQIISSPTINQSPHYMENGTTSEDSDDSGLRGGMVNSLKRPSPEPINDSPSKANKPNAAAAVKKPKPQRKKKKKDPNEPQKPVSAYALFFRDTQAAIKSQNPTASFGEVSTIVASMWDALAHEHKDVYKKKTELAKKEYLKTLAVYRASVVSKGDDIESKPNVSELQQSLQTQSSLPSVPEQPQQQPVKTEPQDHQPSSTSSIQPNNQQFIQQSQNMPSQQQPQMQNMPYQHQFNPNAYKSPPDQYQQMDYNAMQMHHNQMSPINHQHSPIQNIQNTPPMHPQMLSHQQQQQVAIVRPNNTHYGYDQTSQHTNMMPHDPYQSSSLDNLGNVVTHQSPQMHQASMHHQQQQQQQQQNCYRNNGDPIGSTYINASSNQNLFNNNSVSNQQHQLNTTMQQPHQESQQIPVQQPIQQCIRHGCTNRATVNPDWEDEYCTAECVVLHCRNVFNNWIQTNSQGHTQQTFSVVK